MCVGYQAEADGVYYCGILHDTTKQSKDCKEDNRMAAVFDLPKVAYNVRKRENGRNTGTAAALPSSPVPHAEQTPPVEDFDPDVDAFLTRYPFVVSLLRECIDPLWEIFGDQTTLSVTVEADPEVEDWEYLVIAVRTTLPADEAQARLDAFDAVWWLDALPRAQGKVLFTLEFV